MNAEKPEGCDAALSINPKVQVPDVEKDKSGVAEDESDDVKFADGDPDNPLTWSLWRKWTIVALVSTMSMLTSFATLTIVPAVPQVLAEFKVTDNLYSTLLVSIWELGEGVGPFLIAPLSEIYGRLPVYHLGNVLFLLCSVASALSTNISMLVAFRFLNGSVVTALTLGPSIVGDLFAKEERGSAMALAIVFPLVGPIAAPLVGGYTAQAKGWRWTVWISVIAAGAVTLLSLATFRETYKVKILQGKANRIRKENDGDLSHSRHHYITNASFMRSMLRPMKMLLFSPIVLIISSYTAITYGVSYLILTTLTEVLEINYGFRQGSAGLAYLARGMGMIIAIILYGTTSDRYLRFKQRTNGVSKPEYRLPLMLLGAIVIPIGLFLYGWTAAHHVQWVAPLVGTAMVGFSVILTILPTENYLVDAFELHSASAIAAGVVLRALAGAVLPLAGPPLYEKLGLGWGNSVLGFVAVGFVPVVGLLIRYGERIRKSQGFQQVLQRHS